MRNENDDFVSDENGSETLSGHLSSNKAPDDPTLVGKAGDTDVDRLPDGNDLLHWAREQAHVDQIVCEAAEWEQSATFFPKRDQWLSEALRLAYPVFVLLSLRRDEAEAQISHLQAAQDLPKKLIRHKPELAALKLVTKPKNVDDEKKCSEWAYKLRWAQSKSILPSEFLARIGKLSLAEAKAEVRKQRRSAREASGKPVRKQRPAIRVSISGSEGARSFKVDIDEEHYHQILAADKQQKYENANHMLGALENMRSASS